MYQVIYTLSHGNNKRGEYFRAGDGDDLSVKIMDWKNRLKQRYGYIVTVLDVKRVK